MRLLALTLLLGLPLASHAEEPLQSPDAFEAELRRCFLKEADAPGCMGGLLRGRWVPGNEKVNQVVPQLVDLFGRWLGKDTVFALHRVKERKLGELYEERVFVVEDSSGGLLVVEAELLSRKGKWYLLRFNLSSQKDTFRTVLGIDL